MADIYQEIWNADQEGNGIEAILTTETGSAENGYVKVNAAMNESGEGDLKVLTEVQIPSKKMATYDACLKLFNNFTLAEPMPEFDTPEERAELHNFVALILKTKPMEVARAYIQQETGMAITDERWHNTIMEMWFRRFSSGGDPELTGFEHVVVGEQEGAKVQGYHFWWKYYLDDGLGHLVDDGATVIQSLKNDRITYHGSKQSNEQLQFPESVTISYRWHAPDYENNAVRPLFKKIGGFFVGCSVEGLMALGTVRAHKGVQAPRTAVIEGARYDMKLFHSPNGQHIRTFYPIFRGAADIVDAGSRSNAQPAGDVQMPAINSHDDVISSPVRVISAIVNPLNVDAGFEIITVVNVAAIAQPLSGWSMADKNDHRYEFADKELQPGEFLTIKLSGEDLQLSNKGGDITLYDNLQRIVHRVSYSKVQAKKQGVTILF
ncbi:lamin tail domain-containing protein [Vibrio atypicus]|uniref:lamin tail domain-containing protein n=1 Tax=Vibrio atypicus TaxID=558271 RepID=UPI00135C4154|nr:lamin tail domain-containing protein [Vibrio atypicus]